MDQTLPGVMQTILFNALHQYYFIEVELVNRLFLDTLWYEPDRWVGCVCVDLLKRSKTCMMPSTYTLLVLLLGIFLRCPYSDLYFMYVWMIASKLLGMKLFGIELVLMMRILLIWDFELCIA